jgi:hypothetical protein
MALLPRSRLVLEARSRWAASGQHVGSDPDATVRAQMANDPSQADRSRSARKAVQIDALAGL